MKRKIKGLLFTMCMLLGLMALNGCAAAKTETPSAALTDQEITDYKTSTTNTIRSLAGLTDEEMDEYSKSGQPFVIDAIAAWRGVKEELGTYKEVKDQTVEAKGDLVTIKSDVAYEKGNASITFVSDKTQGALSMSFDVKYSMDVLMKRAGLNTIMGLGVVFVMLIFLSFLISLFKHVRKLEDMFGKKLETPGPIPAALPIAVNEPLGDNLINDGELVAVIAAAIAASQNTSTDSFVVRTIKKANASKWKNA